MAAAPALAHPGFENVELSASIWVEGIGEVVAHNPELELFPASNQKLFTAAGAFMLLDTGHRFETTVESVGDLLVIRAGGDPTLRSSGSHSLQSFVAEIRRAGVRTAERLVVDAGHFEPYTTVAGRQDWQLPTYTGPMSAFIVDDNRWRKDSAFLKDPALENGKLLAEQLVANGVGVGLVEHIDHFSESGEVIATVRSAPVAELLHTMLHSSDNEIAESILREIGGGSTGAGITRIESQLIAKCPIISGESGDGSGLSRANLRSSRDWRQLLQLAQSQAWSDDLEAALPVAGQSGTMANRLTGPTTAGIVRAKTGTIIGGRSLSGYAVTRDERLVVFSIVTNGEPSAAADSAAAIDRLITAVLEAS